MIVDASALLAVALGEENWDRFADALLDAFPRHGRQRPTIHDFTMRRQKDVDARPSPSMTLRQRRRLYELLSKAVGIMHDVRNLADGIAYGLAKTEGETLLFKGGDFAQTDIEPALKT